MDKPRRRRRSHARWQALIARAEQSGLGVAEFCRAEDISPASFYQWRKRLAPEAASSSDPQRHRAHEVPHFVELGSVAQAGDGGANGWTIELQLGRDVVLRFHQR